MNHATLNPTTSYDDMAQKVTDKADDMIGTARQAADGALDSLQEKASQQSWTDFSAQLQAAWQAEGYEVQRLNQNGADLKLARNGQSCIVSARRWKAAAHGQEPLRELLAARARQQADQAIYVAMQPLSESTAAWARQNEIIVLDAKGIALLLSKAAKQA